MAQKGISTQEETTAFQNELSKLASNLVFHVNCPLDKAHGIEFIHGFIDEWGNDRRVYMDDRGALVSHGIATLPNFIRFVVDGVPYYAPCLMPPYGGSDPGGQPTMTGVTTTDVRPITGQEVALITDYVLLDTEAAAGMEDYIIAHSRQTHQVAHANLVVVPIQTFRPNGALIGNFRVRIAVSGTIYEVPCDTRIGGPIQPIGLSSSSFSPPTLISSGMHGVSAPVPPTSCPGTITGSKPITIIMEYWTGTTWHNMLPSYPPDTLVHPPSFINGHGNIPLSWSSTTGCVTVYNMPEGSNDTSVTILRMSVKNPTGTIVDGQLYISMTEEDPGCLFLFRTALNWNLPDYVVREARTEYYSKTIRRGYKHFCYHAVPRMNRSKAFFNLMHYGIVRPFVWWWGHRYRNNPRWGWLFRPYGQLWLLLWWIYGFICRKDGDKPPGWKDRVLNVIPTSFQK